MAGLPNSHIDGWCFGKGALRSFKGPFVSWPPLFVDQNGLIMDGLGRFWAKIAIKLNKSVRRSCKVLAERWRGLAGRES